MSGNSWASALQTAPIVIDFWRGDPAPRGVSAGSSTLSRLDVCRVSASGGHQRPWNVSLYLPICTSSPSSRRWDSIRERFT